MTSENNKRIAKNTMFLYIRMFFILIITLFTSRVVLSTLGVVDFGLYNVVGGVVTMMGVLNNAMSVATQRYLTFELGRKDIIQLKKVFSMCLTIFILLAIIVVILSETVGLWFINNKMNIPEERITAVNFVYQYSIISCIISLLSTPYNATIIAHEQMNVYAYVGVIEAFLKLGVAYLLLLIPSDRLASYALLILISQIIVSGAYIVYCLQNFKESKYYFYWNKELFKELISYSSWNLFGSISGLVKGQGLNILLNLFFNPSVNAARGIAYQINSAISLFFTNFYTAIRPQITKYYAEGNIEEMVKLVFRSSKFSFYLIMLVSMPIIIETPYIVNLWLGQLPDYVVPFTRIIIAISAIDAMASPLMTSAHATGKIRLYQSSIGSMTILNIPISYLFLKSGSSSLSVFYVSLFISIICLFMRLWIVQRLMPFPVCNYIVKVILPSILVCVVSSAIPLYIYIQLEETFYNMLLVFITCIISTLMGIAIFGLNMHERRFIQQIIERKISHK